MSNRKEVTKFFLDAIEELQPGNKNVEMYRKHLNGLSDQVFEELMENMASGKVVLPYYSANLVDKDIEIERSLKVGKRLGIEFFQRIWMIDPVTNVRYLTNDKYFIIHLPVRRQSQHVMKGKSVAESDDFIDSLTGQASGASQTSRMSLPEINNLASLGCEKAIEELITVRGGNTEGFLFSKRSLLDNGEYTLKAVSDLGHEVTSTTSLRNLLYGMLLDSTL